MTEVRSLITIAIFVTISFLAGTAFPQEKQISKRSSKILVKFDRDRNVTTVRLKEMTISKLTNEKDVANNLPLHQMGIEVSFSYTGERASAEPVRDVVLKFHAVGSNYIFLRAQQVIAALDRDIKGQDRAFSLGMTDYRSTAPKFNSVYEEFMSVTAPAEALQKLARASSVEIYVGPIGYSLTPDQQKLIAELASELPTPTVPQKTKSVAEGE